jgi:hypothetical protein
MASYKVTVHDIHGRQIDLLGPTPFMSTARQIMLDHAGLTFLPEHEPATRSDVLEVWVIGDRQYRIRTAPQVLVSSVQAIAAFG